MNLENKIPVVVFDTNVLVSAIQFDKLPLDLLDLAVDRRIQLVLSEAILSELYRVLKVKFKRPEEELDWIIDLIIANCSLVEPSERITKIKEDDTDNRILECAVAAKASFIVSGDTKHLLPLKKFQTIEILTPREFMDTIVKSRHQ
ncbi:MAG: putative toxin-antitoxin system toxin component, PIN family [Deltaproteobacteria bacterium]|nr:putative toxin-antitoxin system toxin component, PIN family [Deltaproteobacteria bacterium]